MRRALAFLPVPICGLLAVAAVALAAQPKDGTFKGKSSQKADVTVTVQKKTIKSITFFGYCKGDKSHSKFGYGFAKLDGRVDANGHFSEREAADPTIGNGQVVTFQGRFVTPKVAKGTLRLRGRPGGPCDTGKVKFTIKHK